MEQESTKLLSDAHSEEEMQLKRRHADFYISLCFFSLIIQFDVEYVTRDLSVQSGKLDEKVTEIQRKYDIFTPRQ